MNALTPEMLQSLADAGPFNRWLGIRIIRADTTAVELTANWRDEFVANSDGGYVHGGILASLVDIAAHHAVAVFVGRRVPTIDLRVDYHRPARQGRLLARASVVRHGQQIATADARVFDRHDLLVTSGRAVFFCGTRSAMSAPSGANVSAEPEANRAEEERP